MRILLTITICLVLSAGAQANFFDGLKDTFKGIGDAFTQTANQVGSQAKVVGQQLLDGLKQTGTTLLSQTLQSLLMGTMNAIQNPQPSTKRALGDYLTKLQSLHNDMKSSFDSSMNDLTTVFHSAIDGLKQLAGTAVKKGLSKLPKEIDNVVSTHNALVDAIKDDLVKKIVGKVQTGVTELMTPKRTISDMLSSIGNSLAQTFKPHIDTLKGIVGAVGDGLKQTANQMMGSVTQSLSQLGTQLQGHLQTVQNSGSAIAQHGQNALSALKDAVSDILQQTLTNIQPHIQTIAQTGQSALNTAGQTLLNSLGGAVNSGN